MNTNRMSESIRELNKPGKSVDELVRELAAQALVVERYRSALERIANQDYRGNKSTEQQIAAGALHD